MNRPWPRGVLRARGQRRAGSIAGAMPHVRVAGVAQQQQLSSESSTSMRSSARVVVVSTKMDQTHFYSISIWLHDHHDTDANDDDLERTRHNGGGEDDEHAEEQM